MDPAGGFCGTKGAIEVSKTNAPEGCICHGQSLYFNSHSGDHAGGNTTYFDSECSESTQCLCSSGEAVTKGSPVAALVMGIVFPLLCCSGLITFFVGRRRSKLNTLRVQQTPGMTINAHTLGQQPGQRARIQMQPQYAQPVTMVASQNVPVVQTVQFVPQVGQQQMAQQAIIVNSGQPVTLMNPNAQAGIMTFQPQQNVAIQQGQQSHRIV